MTEDEARKLGVDQAESEINEGATLPVTNTRAMFPELEDDRLWGAFNDAYRGFWFFHFINSR